MTACETNDPGLLPLSFTISIDRCPVRFDFQNQARLIFNLPNVESSDGNRRTAKVEGKRRVWRDIRARSRDKNGSSRSHSLRGMLSGKVRSSSDTSWSHTPESSPRHSPVPSDLDSDDEERMDGWGSTRPLSIAVPGSQHTSRPTLDDVLSNRAPPPYTLTAFMAYLSQNHCLETLEFTMDAKRYGEHFNSVMRQLGQSVIPQESPQAEHLRMLWGRLISAYIVPGSPREINLPSTVRDALLHHSQSRKPPHPDALDAAVKRMRDLMDESIFIPFLNSRSVTLQPSQPSHAYRESLTMDESRIGRNTSIRRQLSPQASFASPRSATSGYSSHPTTSSGHSTNISGSRSSGHGYTSGESASGNLTDDSGSIPSSPGAGEPMTPPTTPPSSDMHSPKNRSDNAWKKMGMKFGWKK